VNAQAQFAEQDGRFVGPGSETIAMEPWLRRRTADPGPSQYAVSMGMAKNPLPGMIQLPSETPSGCWVRVDGGRAVGLPPQLASDRLGCATEAVGRDRHRAGLVVVEGERP
jgi:hypothetical protein